MTLYVLGASVALAWSFKDEVSPYATFIVRSARSARAVAPVIWPLEVNNALISAVQGLTNSSLTVSETRSTDCQWTLTQRLRSQALDRESFA